MCSCVGSEGGGLRERDEGKLLVGTEGDIEGSRGRGDDKGGVGSNILLTLLWGRTTLRGGDNSSSSRLGDCRRTGTWMMVDSV